MIYLTETRQDISGGEYTEIWHTQPPEKGVKYRVVREHWSDFDVEPITRDIYEIRLVEPFE